MSMKKAGADEKYCMWFICPECGCENIMTGFKFCPDCGILLPLEDENKEKPNA